MPDLIEHPEKYEDGEIVAVELRLSAEGPIPLKQLSEAFIGLEDMFQHRLRTKFPDLKGYLAVNRVSEGSQIYQIVAMAGGIALPYAATVYDAMVKTVAVADFADRLIKGARWLTDVFDREKEPKEPLAKQELDGINDLLKAIAGKRGAGLGVRKLRLRTKTRDSEVELQLEMGQDDVNSAAIHSDRIAKEIPALPDLVTDGSKQFNEVVLEFEQANVGPGKEAGRTGDKGIIREISAKPCPVYFRAAIQELKEQMMRGDENPFGMLYVVSVNATMRKGEPMAYTITDIHTKMPR